MFAITNKFKLELYCINAEKLNYYVTLFFLGGYLLMLSSIKEKSWSVLLIKGHLLNDQVRAKRCENCKSRSEVIAGNYSNPNLFLYGCADSKCKHRLLRLDFDREVLTAPFP